ncbi:unnamed protein product [Prorocentrum cordatum]|uniref:Glycosyltransferase 2-like domain-containing protein n=1 Tax=Prorocentrum cordatum TaxID=2364126 RepID=A0ABN9WQU4_9DINO|nr:unnamed protein product [Polarella glacialis]
MQKPRDLHRTSGCAHAADPRRADATAAPARALQPRWPPAARARWGQPPLPEEEEEPALRVSLVQGPLHVVQARAPPPARLPVALAPGAGSPPAALEQSAAVAGAAAAASAAASAAEPREATPSRGPEPGHGARGAVGAGRAAVTTTTLAVGVGADIWDGEQTWFSIKEVHPAGVVPHTALGVVLWADVSYMNMTVLLIMSSAAYPGCLVVLLYAMMVWMSIYLDTVPSDDGISGEPNPIDPSRPALPVLPRKRLTERSRRAFKLWTTFCRTVPSLLIFGTPMVVWSMAYRYPQEIVSTLIILTSAFIFNQGVYVSIFGNLTMTRMQNSMRMDFEAVALGGHPADALGRVTHWVILPQYKEGLDVVSMALASVAQSHLAPTSIHVVLAMEFREPDASGKAEELQQKFKGKFKEIFVTYHPPDLPNDPPGKASNLSWAFQQLAKKMIAEGRDTSSVIITVADADSEFSPGFFELLTSSFLHCPEEDRHFRFWQSPILHLKNYHRLPGPVVVGTMFTASSEMAALADPNAVRFPYSTYSLSFDLAAYVGGWDPDWIAEDYHMGIKCFLLTFGRTRLEPILVPTLNYTPEDTTWVGTCQARWAQAKRHALGISDVAYYFTMLPLLFSLAVDRARMGNGNAKFLQFWYMATTGLSLLVKLVNLHVMIGMLSIYGVSETLLRTIMLSLFHEMPGRTPFLLFSRTHFVPSMLAIGSMIFSLASTTVFLRVYRLVRERLEDNDTKGYSYTLYHQLSLLVSYFVWGAPSFILLGTATWMAAIKGCFSNTFEYEVALKPTSDVESKPWAAPGAPPRAPPRHDAQQTERTQRDFAAAEQAFLDLCHMPLPATPPRGGARGPEGEPASPAAVAALAPGRHCRSRPPRRLPQQEAPEPCGLTPPQPDRAA